MRCPKAENCHNRIKGCMDCSKYNRYRPIVKSPNSNKNRLHGLKDELKEVKQLQKEGIVAKQQFMSGAKDEKGDIIISNRFMVDNKREKGFNKVYNYMDKIIAQAGRERKDPLLRIHTEGKYDVYCMPGFLFRQLLKEIDI